MTLEEANVQAQQWWGERGKAVFIPFSFEDTQGRGRYWVGLTALKARLGGRITTVFGTSRVSFDIAFETAYDMGNGPLPCGSCGKCLDCLRMERDNG